MPECRSAKVKAKVLEAASSPHDRNTGRNFGAGVTMAKGPTKQAGSQDQRQTQWGVGVLNRSSGKAELWFRRPSMDDRH